MAIDAGFHAVVHFLGQFGAFLDRAVAARAFHGRVDVAGVAEKDVVGQAIDALGREFSLFRIAGVAGPAGGGLGKSGSLGLCGSGMAVGAAQLERGVRLMRENRARPGRQRG